MQPQPMQVQPNSVPGGDMSGKPVAQITNVPLGIPAQTQTIQQLTQQMAQLQFMQQQQQLQQQQQQQQLKQPTVKPARGRFNLLSPHAALQAVASRLLPKSSSSAAAANQQQQQPQLSQPQLPQLIQNMKQLTVEQQQKLFAAGQQQQQLSAMLAAKQFGSAQVGQQQQQQQQHAPSGLFARITNNLHPQQQPQGLVRTRRSAILSNGGGKGELGLTRSFMVVTGMDLAFAPNLTDSELPQVLEGRRLFLGSNDDEEGDIVYGVCMPIVSLTFFLTCAFWLVVFLLSFSMYMLIKSLRQNALANKSKQDNLN